MSLAVSTWAKAMANRTALDSEPARRRVSCMGGFVTPPSLGGGGRGPLWGFGAGTRDTRSEQVGLELRAGGSFGKNSPRPCAEPGPFLEHQPLSYDAEDGASHTAVLS